MKFKCSQCKTAHALSDQALPAGQSLRFVCPQCNHAMTVRRPAAGPPVAAPPQADSAGALPIAIPAAPGKAPPPRAASPFDDTGTGKHALPLPPVARAAANAAKGLGADGLYDGSGSDDSDDAEEPVFAPSDSDATEPVYTQQAPGKATQLFMQTAGIYRRRRNLRIAAWACGATALFVVLTLGADMSGLIEIPFLGTLYDATGFSDPNVHRAIERAESRLSDNSLTRGERDQLRRKLLGLTDEAAPPGKSGRSKSAVAALDGKAPPAGKAAELYSKMEGEGAHDADGTDGTDGAAQADGGSPPEVGKIIADNSKSLAMCYAEASRRARPPAGKLEIRLTIKPSGDVGEVKIVTEKYRNTPMGRCAYKRVKGWKFPRSNGDPMTVVFPYVLTNEL